MTPFSPSPSWSDESLSFLTGENAQYVLSLYASYLRDRASVSPEWRDYFSTLPAEEKNILNNFMPPIWDESSSSSEEKGTTSTIDQATILESSQAMRLIQAYRSNGHKGANLDPLGLTKQIFPPELDPQTYGFTATDDDRPLLIDEGQGLTSITLRDLVARLRHIYCGTIGVEFLHIQDPVRQMWLQNRIEGNEHSPPLTTSLIENASKKQILQNLLEAEEFEQFLHKKYPAAKRFGLDGAESLIPGIDEILTQASDFGVQGFVMGMAHRGRLNVLTHIMGKSYTSIFAEFQGKNLSPSLLSGAGDVKYHLGASVVREFQGRKMHLSLLSNPSHLEAIDPVVVGNVRGLQTHLKDPHHTKVMGLLLHGDAAFSGQGIVAETLQLSRLEGYQTGGTFHVIINNQIGFTTNPEDERSSQQCSDIATIIQAPIFHVNGNDVEAVVNVMRLASQYRQTFQSDVVIDLVCYRRFGHNEGDEPSFTQPLMYKAIATQPSIGHLYAQKLKDEGVIEEEELSILRRTIDEKLQKNFHDSATYEPPHIKEIPLEKGKQIQTGVDKKILMSIGAVLSQAPQSFHLHPKLTRGFAARRDMVAGTHPLDWAMGEALAFGSLLWEGHHVRLSGQDVERGTFSQRHAVLIDQESEEKYIPLNHLSPKQALFEVWNSPLAEASILGFEVGYSYAEPKALVCWEAQFGDFANGAQVIIDQFISVGEAKWLRQSGIVMLLPHGYEGQGPEHSSARLERYLQLCAQDNMQIINCTTPANFFHGLRRQIHFPPRKPLIAMTPKSLLRYKHAVSPLKDFETGSHFQDVIPDPLTQASRVILCSGKVYYDLLEAREENKIQDIALLRLEQLYPFPHETLVKILKPYQAADLVWCQEEPMNMGAWTFLDRRLEAVLSEVKMKVSRPLYVGRPESASTATGLVSRHAFEQDLLVRQALNLNARKK